MPLQTGHVGLNVSNLQRSRKFYQEVFGLQLHRESEENGRRFAMLSRDSRVVLTLWEQTREAFDKGNAGLHHLAFLADNIDEVRASEEKLKALNICFLYDGIVPHAEGAQSGGIFFEDPDGIRLEIYAAKGAGVNSAPTPGAPSCGFF